MSQTAALPVRSVAAAVAGNVLEFYDFLTYTFFAVSIGEQFFPSNDQYVSLMLSIGTFSISFLTRPLGGIVIGAYADRVGRKPAMMLTVILMAAGMLAIALTPSYKSIGIAAPLIVLLARLVQGFALGGEVGPATSFLVEAAPSGRRGYYASWQIASQGLATLMAGLVGLALAAWLPPSAMQAWGWRVPFLLGILIIPAAIFMRRNLPETAQLDMSAAPHTDLSGVVSTLFEKHRKSLCFSLLLISSSTIGTYILNYMTTYARTALHMPQAVSIAATLMLGIFTFLSALVGGALSDRWGRKALIGWPRLFLVIAGYPSFLLMLAWHNALALLSVTALLGTLNAIANGVSLAVIPENFPRSVRSAGLAISYAMGVTIFGGTTQLVITWLIHQTGNPLSPAWYLTVANLVGFLSVVFMRETGHVGLKD